MSYQLYAQPVPTTGQSKPSNTGQTQTAETGTPKEGKKPDASPFAGMGSLLFPVLLIAVFYFLLIRPQQKKEKKRKEMLKQLKKNDKVLTRGGMLGVIVGLKEEAGVATVKIAPETKVEVAINAIEVVNPKAEETQKA